MKINSVKLNNFRNYTNAVINFSDGVNFILGKNAQGKTNLLERIYLCAISKSPKTAKEKQMINFDAEYAQVLLNFNTIAGNKNIEIILNNSNKKIIKINNIPIVKLTQLIGELNVVYFSPDELKLVKETPEDRRKFLDISISQFDKTYMFDLIRYDKILKKRNCVLKSNISDKSKIEQLNIWTPQLILTAEKIIKKRILFVENLKKYSKMIYNSIIVGEKLDISYSFEEKNNISIFDDLNNQFNLNLKKELEMQHTLIGPHRDDIIFKINNQDCRYFASQGQQRTVALTLKLALMEIIKEEVKEYPVLLLDDVLSELDNNRQERLLSIVKNYQTIITCADVNLNLQGNKIFIEQGQQK
ncbi:MAG: DNA replication/repair protein RecF [Clostridia bacterium]|nr:DNA replication/repair protein RecF [Clostridia bacterium]